MAIIHGRVDTKKYKEAMKKNGLLMPSIEPRESIVNIPTVLSPFHAALIASVKLSVLGQLGISGRVLSRLSKRELIILLCMLQSATSAVKIKLDKRTGE